MTRIIGRPDTPAGAALTATLTYIAPYQRTDRLGMGTASLTWDESGSRWLLTGTTAEYDLVAARWEQNDPAPPGNIRMTFRFGTGAGAQGSYIEFPPAETASGVLDIRVPLTNLKWVSSEDLDALIARTEAAAERAEQASPMPTLSGTQAQRRAYDRSVLTKKTQWNVTEPPYQTYWYTPGDTAWRDSSGDNPDETSPPDEATIAPISRTAEQTRLTSGLYGQRSGRGLPTFERGAAAYLVNDGTGPFTATESPKMIRFGWAAGTADNVAYTSFRGKATPFFDPAGRLSASVWLRLADLANVTFVELLLFGYASPSSSTTLLSGPQVTPTQLATPGYTYTGVSNGVEATCTVGAVRNGWAQLTLITAAGLGGGTTFVEFLVRLRVNGAGKLDLMAPAMLNTTDAVAPQALPRDALDLSPEDAAKLPMLTSSDFWALGDSIVRGQTYSSEANTWARLFSNWRGLTLHNFGINGSNACSPGAPGGNSLVDRTAAIPDGAGGLAEISIGTNDWNNAGTCPLGAPGSTDKSTYYGAMLLSGRDVLRRTTCFLILSTPLWRGDAGRTEGTRLGGWTLEQYRQAVRDVAAQLADEYPGRVMLLDAGRDLADFFSGGGMGADNLHPADAGNLRLAQYRDQRVPRFQGPRLPIDGQATVFGALAANSALSGQLGWTAYAGATATVSGDRKGLTINAKFDDPASGNPATSPAVLHDLPAGVRRVVMALGAPTGGNSGTILRAFHNRATDRAICAWTLNGILDFGIIQGGQPVQSWRGVTGGGLSGETMLEVLREGGQVEVRYWPANQPRPDAPTDSHADVALTADAYGISTIGAIAQTVLSVTVAG